MYYENIFSWSWMTFFVDFLQPFSCNVSINLGRGNVRMPQHDLD